MENKIGVINPPQRKSNIELLRIISMIMIIAHHIGVHSGFSFSTDTSTINELWILFIEIGGKIGVDIFVLISGYFLINAKSLESSKVLKLWVQIFSYSAAIYIVLVLFGIESFEGKAFINNFLPITYSKWWFASAYFVLYLISPYINKLLNALNKKEYQRLLILLFVFWCIIPTFLARSWQSNSLLWFVFLYALAGYFRLYVDSSAVKSGKYIGLSLVFTFLTYLSAVVMDILSVKYSAFANYVTYFYDMQRLPVLLISATLFLGFININIGCNPIINIIASSTFGIYLLHDNSFIRGILWKTIFKNASYGDSKYLIPYTLFEIVAVFVVCATIELFRIYVVERAYIKKLNRLSNRIDILVDKFFDKI